MKARIKNLILCAVFLALLFSTAKGQMWDMGCFPVPTNDNCRHLRAYGDYCFICKYSSQLIVADISNPYQPYLASSVNLILPGYFTVAEDFLYASGCGYTGEAHIFNLSNLPSLIYSGSTPPPSEEPLDLEARGDYLYVPNYDGGLVIYDISDRDNPIEVNRISNMGQGHGIKLSENYLYLGVAGYGLRIFDISDPEEPLLVSSLPMNTGSYPMLNKDGDYVYFATYTNGFKIINVSNPQNPYLVSTINPSSLDRYLEISNNRLFLSNWSNGVLMYDITNPVSPTFISSIPTWFSGAYDLAISGHTLCEADLSKFRTIGYAYAADGYYQRDIMEYNWLEISVTGEPHDLAGDNFTEEIDIGFDFPFYDNVYDYLYVCSNGFIAFNNYSPSRWDTPIPCDTQPNDIIAPFWDDFDPAGSPFNIFTQLFTNPTYFVIEFQDMPRVGTTEVETFEVILYPDGDIKFQYPDIVNATSATAGIENETGTRGTQLCHNPIKELPDSLAIGFVRLVEGATEIDEDQQEADIPQQFDCALSASPNPFNPSTVLSFEMRDASFVKLTIYDIAGREVATVIDGFKNDGLHSVTFDGSDLASGIYYARLQAGEFVKTQKMVMMK